MAELQKVQAPFIEEGATVTAEDRALWQETKESLGALGETVSGVQTEVSGVKLDVAKAKTDISTHVGDALAHDGFVGRYKPFPNFTDFNQLTTQGIYEGVVTGALSNEPLTGASSIRRLRVEVSINSSSGVVFQKVTYLGPDNILGINFERSLETPTLWIGLITNRKQQWIAAVLSGGWTPFDSNDSVSYCKNELGEVRLRGRIKGGTVGTATAAFTLASGYRSKQHVMFITGNGNKVYITPDGKVHVYDGGAHDVWLDGITFLADGG